MFTGIVEILGQVTEVTRGEESAVFTLNLNGITEGLAIGDSVALNGCCLTVTDINQNDVKFDVMTETLNVTSLGSWQTGSKANAERAMAADGRFGGHVVSGHVDGTAEIVAIEEQENSTLVSFQAESFLTQDMLLRGSVSVDGVSLTICDLDQSSGRFSVSIIPHTFEVTLFGQYIVGDKVNIETDMMSKYIRSHVERILKENNNS